MFHQEYALLAQWLVAHTQLANLLIFAVAFSECLALVGSIVPGSVTMTAIGLLIGAGVLPLWTSLIWAISGAILGDSLSYGLGYRFKEKVRTLWPFKRYPAIFIRGQSFVLRHGGKSIFIGRFVGPVRAIVPVVAGMFDMKPSFYFAASVPAACVWAPLYMLPGILVGAAALGMPADVARHLIAAVLLTLISLWALYQAVCWLYRRTHRAVSHALDTQWLWWQAFPARARWVSWLKNAENPTLRGQLFSAYFAISMMACFVGLLAAVIYGHAFLGINHQVYHFFRGLRTPTLDGVMVSLSAWGSAHWIEGTGLILVAVLWIFYRRHRAALHLAISTAMAAAGVFALKHIAFNARPSGIAWSSPSSSFPSGHTTLAVVYYGFLAFLLARSVSRSFRPMVYGVAISLVGGIGFSRIYLSAHWLSDVVAGVVLGSLILTGAVVAYRRLAARERVLPAVSMVAFLTLLFAFSMVAYWERSYARDLKRFQPHWERRVVDLRSFWEHDDDAAHSAFPLYRTNRLGYPVEFLNLQWCGDIRHIRATLRQRGFTAVRTHHYTETLAKIIDQERPVSSDATLFARLYQDHPPSLEMRKPGGMGGDGDSPAIILRLWPTHTYVLPHKTPIWIGTFYRDVAKRRFILTHHHAIPLTSVEMSRLLGVPNESSGWDIKWVTSPSDRSTPVGFCAPCMLAKLKASALSTGELP